MKYIKSIKILESSTEKQPKIRIFGDTQEASNVLGEYFPPLKHPSLLSNYHKQYGDFYLITNPESKEAYSFHIHGDPKSPSIILFDQNSRSINMDSIYPQTLKDGDLEKMFLSACEEYGLKMYKAVVWAKKNLHSLSSSFYDDCMKVLAEKVKEDPSSVSLIQEYPEIQDELGGEFSKKFPDLFNIFKSGVNL
jgi:hypothetical protein